MTPRVIDYDWTVTAEKVNEAVRRIVEKADPLQIIAFGSRARGDHRPDSDLDLAVILDAPERDVHQRVSYALLEGIPMSVDLVVVSKSKYDLHRPWLNSVYNYIDQEGVVLYDRDHPESARPDALFTSEGRREDPAVSAA